MELYSVFVTGANRGIGLEFVRQLVQLRNPPQFVFATYRSRDGTEDLKKIRDSCKRSQVLLYKMDVTKLNEIKSARKIAEDMVGNGGLTLLINNAGAAAHQRFPNITEENLSYHFKTNTIGPVMVMQELLPLLQKAAARRGLDSRKEVNRAAVLNISAAVGSSVHMAEIDVAEWPCPSYSISKAALNMVCRTIAASIKEQGILVVLMCPGWVKTDMGTDIAELSVEDSVASMLKTLPNLNESHHGEFMDRNGKLYQF